MPKPSIDDSANIIVLTDWVEEAIAAAIGSDSQAGAVVINGSSVAAGGAASLSLTFPFPFPAAPRVFVSLASAPGGANFLVPRAINATPTGCSVYVYNTGSSAYSWTGLQVNWLAKAA